MLKPSIFRHTVPHKIPGANQLTHRFEKLKSAERELVYRYENAGLLKPELLKRQRILRWSILQHYHLCGTPLLDVTHSLRIAASFASLKATGDAFVFVLGVPNLSGAITASAEAGLQIVRLSSVCPPTVVRPHIQEGYLLGEYPDISKYDQEALYHAYEIDFGRRLVAKFRFNPLTFWKPDTFPKGEEADLLLPMRSMISRINNLDSIQLRPWEDSDESLCKRSDSKRREFAPESKRASKTQESRAVVGKERRQDRDYGRLNSIAGAGGNPQAPCTLRKTIHRLGRLHR